MTRDELLQRISVDPNVCFGRPCVRGTRIWVSLLLDLLASGMSESDLRSEYPQLSADDIRAALAFGAEMTRERYVGVKGGLAMTHDLMEEVAKLQRVPGIIFADGPTGRRARIAGTGLEVFEIITTYNQTARDWNILKESFDWLSDDQLKAALAYYEAYPEEIDAWIDADEEASIEAFWREHPYTRPPWR